MISWILHAFIFTYLLGHTSADDCLTDETVLINTKSLQNYKKSDTAWKHIKSKTPHAQKYDNIDIPIIFHILFNDTDQINPNKLYNAYINILKNMTLTFNKNNSDISTFNLWRSRLGNMKLSFFINQIRYHNVGNNSPYPGFPDWQLIQSPNTGDAPIDPDHNLDIYFINAEKHAFGCYAFYPWQQAENNHGITCRLDYLLGIREPNYQIYTHEVGHWSGLKHIWGLKDISCDHDDSIDDTPNMAETYKNKCPLNHNGDSCTDDNEPDMWDNFMSYSTCRNMYSQQQVKRSRTPKGENGELIGIRESFSDYKKKKYMADMEFVSMFYFIDKHEKCMVNDIKKNFCK
eukprot:407251_1